MIKHIDSISLSASLFVNHSSIIPMDQTSRLNIVPSLFGLFPRLEADRCGDAHIAFFSGDRSGQSVIEWNMHNDLTIIEV